MEHTLKNLMGTLSKMSAHINSHTQVVHYSLTLGTQQVCMNDLLGKTISLTHTGAIYCRHCQQVTKKSFNQGYCYPCFRRLARCDLCIFRPERCHFHLGTCREPEWGQEHCMQTHTVYLANTSGCKVGITRNTQIPTRWIDQGAVQALPLFHVPNRKASGVLETLLAQQVSDRTQWQKMLRGTPEPLDLIMQRDALLRTLSIEATPLTDARVHTHTYPVLQYPKTIRSLSFNRAATVSGCLWGIKGQYLILDSGVLNIRQCTGYHVQMHVESHDAQEI